MRILVTGDSGLIGSYLTEKLYQKGHKVYGLSRTARNVHIYKTIHLNVDLQDKALTAVAIREVKPEMVFHLAANVAEGKSQTFPRDITQNNIGIFMNVLVPAIKSGMKRFIFLSSNAVYGEIQTPYKETDTPKPQDIYAINKLASEEALKILAKVYNFEYLILRPHNVYGPRQYMKDRYKNVVMLFMNQILRGEPYTLFGNGALKRNFSYVEDVVDVIYKSAFSDLAGEILNIGSDTQTSIKELSDVIQEVTGTTIEPQYIQGRKQDVHTAVPSHEKQNTLFGYNETSLKEGIKKTWEWAKDQGAQDYDVEVPEL